MKVLYFDCFSGISGDMTVGALLALGIDKGLFLNELNKLKLDGYDIAIEQKVKSGITVTDFDVILKNEHHNHSNPAGNHSSIEHHHNHESSHHHHGNKHHHDSRNLVDINELIDKSQLNDKVKALSKNIFKEIALAEAKVHNKGVNEVHFHEVGAIDSIVDIVGASICLDLLGVERVFSSALHDGQGFIECQHGLMPVPVPAVMEMLQGSNIPLISENINTELITPTGMAIIKSLSEDYGQMPKMTIDRVGYGAGKRETGRLNSLRVVLGNLVTDDIDNNITKTEIAKEVDKTADTFKSRNEGDEIIVLETNIDDSTPEILGYTMERLLKNGARDAFSIPVYMKKNRPGVLLTVLTEAKDEQRLVDIIFKETSTIGIRRSVQKRYCMERKTVTVTTEYGNVRVKVANNDSIKKATPEYEDCKWLAEETGKSLTEIYQMVLYAYNNK